MIDPTTKGTILVIEDETQIRRLLRVTLEKAGYRVEEAATGENGIAEAARCSPDAVLLDLGLPDMDGVTLLKRVREWSMVPIIIVSARGHENEKIIALDNGANDYVTKPFSAGELMARLRAALRHSKPAVAVTEFRSGPLLVDLASRAVKVNDKRVRLTATDTPCFTCSSSMREKS